VTCMRVCIAQKAYSAGSCTRPLRLFGQGFCIDVTCSNFKHVLLRPHVLLPALRVGHNICFAVGRPTILNSAFDSCPGVPLNRSVPCLRCRFSALHCA
jgi:hypothetical protein